MTEAVKPEQKMQDIESSSSNLVPDSKGQMTEAEVVTDSKTHMRETNVIPDQNCQLTEDSNSDKIPDLKGMLLYRCKKCRQIVASDENRVFHEQGNGEASFKLRKMSVEQSAPECTAIFVEPLKWMTPVQEGYLSDKLYCIGCKCKLGFFTWVGMQCSCGAWVRPAFQIHKSRIDECRI